MIARRPSRDVIVAFCWDNPKLLPPYLELIKTVREHWEVDVVFVTTGVQTKLTLIAAGHDAVTIRDLYNVTRTKPAPAVSSADTRRLTEIERLLDWRWYPAPPAVRGEEYHTLQAERTFAAYEYVLDQLRPRVVLVWNGGVLLPGSLAVIAAGRDIPVFYLERGLVPDTLVVDSQGVNFGSAIAGDGWKPDAIPQPSGADREQMSAYCRALRESGRSVITEGARLGRDTTREQLRVPRDARVVLFPLQIESDTNIVRYSPHYKRMVDVVRDLQRVLAATGAILVVKPHPEDRNRLPELRRLCDNKTTRLATDLSVRSLIDAADVIVTVNSTVGLEALIAEKPVVVLGNAIYSGKGFTHDLVDATLLATTIETALAAGIGQSLRADVFVGFMVFLRKCCLFDLDVADPWGSRAYISERIRAAGKTAPDAAGIGRADVSLSAATADAFYSLIRGGPPRAACRVLLAWPPRWLDSLIPEDGAGRRVRWLRNKWDLPCVLLSWFRRFDVAVCVEEPAGRRRLVWRLLRAREKVELA